MAKPKNPSRAESQKLRSAVLGGCFLLSMILLVVYTGYVVSFSKLSFWRSNREAPPVAKPAEKITSSHQAYAKYQKEKLPSNPYCDSSKRNEYCEMEGDIRIHGNSSSIFFVTSPNVNATKLQESWKFKPHPRKGDARAMARVTEMSVKTLTTGDAPKCAVHNSVPAIVFSTGGYMGNFFHDFTDILIPIFTTSQQFNGEVQFLISEILPWWNDKYKKILQPLTNYEIIDFNQDHTVRCYPHVIVGLKYHKEMSIDPSRSPYGLSMVDFGKYVRKSLGLERDMAIKLGPNQEKKPRILIVARKWTRRFANVDEIIRGVEQYGFEAVVAESKYNDVAEFARIVNSCDVMLGVHGAGLTNLVFLPTNAVVIQVIPLGGLEGISWIDFGLGTISMKMHYLQYTISLEESTLTEEFARGDPVLSDTKEAYRKNGWDRMIDLYFAKQGVKLDMARFGSTLLHAIELLQQQ
ncbi:EGF domain-specific O-linked N-acetylglucosamine transferase [Canna indica]|uniref:EGF domain-specific O-linked N-acetylglucosamine transferase n=1 Tax=Canna indica TaxID=4628 RepID=A0AAQ3KVG8_9LILI|nr:EGF domain-specific O-linked N-acetylglucosamine transferase [Canna indica]